MRRTEGCEGQREEFTLQRDRVQSKSRLESREQSGGPYLHPIALIWPHLFPVGFFSVQALLTHAINTEATEMRPVVCRLRRLGGQEVFPPRLCMSSSSPWSTSTRGLVIRRDPMLAKCAEKESKGFSINGMIKVASAVERRPLATLLSTSQYVYKELQISGAQVVKCLYSLPYGLPKSPAVEDTLNVFYENWKRGMKMKMPETAEEEQAFHAYTQGVLREFQPTVARMAKALSQEDFSADERLLLQPFLDQFFITRIGNRMLMAQYNDLHRRAGEGWAGIIKLRCNVRRIVTEAVEEVTSLCFADGVIPQINVTGPAFALNYPPVLPISPSCHPLSPLTPLTLLSPSHPFCAGPPAIHYL